LNEVDAMAKIGPGRTFKELKQAGERGSEGRGRPPAPGVKTDAYRTKGSGYQANRELNRRIGKAMLDLKGEVGGKPKFVIAWRLYPNLECDYWDESKLQEHVCSCACSCACVLGP
jgi:hypothetical protein